MIQKIVNGLLAMVVIALMFTGCDEGTNMIGGALNGGGEVLDLMVGGEVKEPPVDPVKPIAPAVPIEEITAEVDYYHDAGLTDNLASALYADEYDPEFNYFRPGDTVRATVTFSHSLQVVAQANPTLFMVLNSEKVLQFRAASPDAFTSGTYRKENNRRRYVCKYTVSPNAFGHLQLTVELGERVVTGEFPLQAVLSLTCNGSEENRTVDLTETLRENDTDFVGWVLTPRHDPTVIPLEGVRLTVMSGPQKGKRTVSNQNGEFVFPDVAGDELHLRLEKPCYETKEMLLYRSRPSALPDGTTLGYRDIYREAPGVVLMGHSWPEPVRPFLKQISLPHDLLYFHESYVGRPYYRQDGVVAIQDISPAFESLDSLLILFGHELFHAHQHAAVAVDGSGRIEDWEETPEGRAFIEMQEKDLREFGEFYVRWDNPVLEDSAEIMARVLWSVTTNSAAESERRKAMPIYQELKNNAPHRLQWAQEWHENQQKILNQ